MCGRRKIHLVPESLFKIHIESSQRTILFFISSENDVAEVCFFLRKGVNKNTFYGHVCTGPPPCQ